MIRIMLSVAGDGDDRSEVERCVQDAAQHMAVIWHKDVFGSDATGATALADLGYNLKGNPLSREIPLEDLLRSKS